MKTEIKHTPGPWLKSHNGQTHTVVYNAAELPNFGMRIANVPDPKEGFGRGEANARLIAAAPELLYALKGILEGDSPNWTDIARTAIAKAEGTEPPLTLEHNAYPQGRYA